MNLNLIVAIDENNGIGKNNQLPWYLPADLKHFKVLTMGHPIIMGRKTFDSIEKPLPNRQNIIISRQTDLKIEGADVVHSLQGAIELCNNQEEVFIVGGSQIFEQAMPLAHKLYLTIIHHTFDADTYFPKINKAKWIEVEKSTHEPDERNAYSYTFITYHNPDQD